MAKKPSYRTLQRTVTVLTNALELRDKQIDRRNEEIKALMAKQAEDKEVLRMKVQLFSNLGQMAQANAELVGGIAHVLDNMGTAGLR